MMAALPQRRSTRAAHIDYAASGAYFVTIVCQGRELLFGEVRDDATLVLSEAGRIVESAWRALPGEFARVALDAFIVMPNHVHGIVWLLDDESVGAGLAPPGGEDRDRLVAPPIVEEATLLRFNVNPSSGGASPAPTPLGTGCETAGCSSDGASPARTPMGGGWETAGHSSDGASPAPTAGDVPSRSTVDARVRETPARCSLHDVMRVFKSRSARAIGRPIWQRSFHDHVIRDEDDLAHARRYIAENLIAWALDPENPARRASA